MDVLGNQLALHACILHFVRVHEQNRLAVYLLDLHAKQVLVCGIRYLFLPLVHLWAPGNFLLENRSCLMLSCTRPSSDFPQQRKEAPRPD